MHGETRPLIGRERELAIVDRLLGAVSEGTSAVLYVVGEPGIGKTAVISEAIERASESGYTTLSGRAAEFERDLPFAVFSDALEPRLALLETGELASLVSDPGPLATAFPSLRLLRKSKSPAGTDERQLSFRVVRALLDGLADARPLVIALDDLHWADPASIDLICQILHRPLERPVLLLLAARSHLAPARLVAALEEAERREGGQRLELAALSPAEAGELLGDGIDATLSEHLYRESGGNPFYLEQLASAVRRGTHAAAVSENDPTQAVPRAVTAAIMEEIEGLSAAGKTFLHGAAVTGESFEPELAAETAGIPGSDALDALDELLSRDLIRPTGLPRRFRFRHPIVRRAVYESAGAGRTLAAHGRAAAALAARNAPASARAHHIERSATMGDMEAVSLLAVAGEESSSHAPASAAHWFEAALRLLPASEGNAQLRLELLTRRATALGIAGYLEEARDALRELLKLLPPELTPVRRRAVAVAEVLEDVLGNHADCEQMLLRELGNVSDPKSHAAMELATSLAINSFFRNDWAGMKAWAGRALEAEPSSTCARVAALGVLAIAAYTLGDPVAHEKATSESAALFDGLSDVELAEQGPGVAIWLGIAETCAEHLDDAIRHLERAVSIARTTGQRHLIPGMLAFVAQPLMMQGRLVDAERNADAVMEQALMMDTDRHRRIAMTMRSAVEVMRGDVYAAVRFAEQGIAEQDKDDTPSSVGRMVLAEALLEIGEPERCLEQLLSPDGAPRFPRLPYSATYCHLLATHAALALGDVDRADAYAAGAEDLARQFPRMATRSASHRARAVVHLARGDAAAARTEATAAMECAERLGARISAAHIRVLLGAALAGADERPAAIKELESAYADLGSLGAFRYQDEAARALRKLGRAVPRRHAGEAADRTLGGLTKRELEVLSLVGEGRTNRQIAAELYLSRRTVDRHVSRIFEKLGVSSRAAAASTFERSRHGARDTAPA